ncbi:J domain-containing protein [Pseudolysinimonas sp.]|uniref:J domain-containing protein n=1 Tax=Pseudolysinimonas sp. TaxID=2680009 RepID=UPI003F8186ED
MSDSPLAASPYEVLGVTVTATDDELRRAYRRRLRETHPDTGGAALEFDRVQRAWELVGTADARAAYDRGVRPAAEERSWAPAAPPRGEGTRPAARMHGHPGGWYREQFLVLLQEWSGRGVDIPDPYDPQLLARAPRELRHLLAEAVAEEETARALATLGMGFTVWHDLRTDDPRRDGNGLTASPQGAGGKIDHVVLGPTGLWAMLSEDWGEPVSVKRGEIAGPALAPHERPVHELSVRARALAREARVRFTALVIVVPDGAAPEGVVDLGGVRGARALLVERPRLVDLVRRGIAGVGIGGTDLFEVRTRLQSAARFV